MKLMKRAAVHNLPSQVRHCAVTPKIIINFWQKQIGLSSPPSIMTKLWYCDMDRGSDIVTEQERSHAVATRPRPSHATKKDKTVRTGAFQASRY